MSRSSLQRVSTLACSHFYRRWVVLLGLLLGCFGTLQAAQARQKILVVLSEDRKIFLEVIQALPKKYDADYQVVRLNAPGIPLGTGSYDAVVALGQAAAQQSLLREKTRPVFFAGVVSTQDLAFRAPNAFGVDIDPSGQVHVTRLKKTLPKARRLGIIGDFKLNPARGMEVKTQAEKAGLSVEVCHLGSPRDLAICTQKLVGQQRAEVILALPAPNVYTKEGLQNLVRSATAQRIALIASGRYFTDAYPFLYSLAPDGLGTAMDLADLMKDKFLLRKTLPPLSPPKYLVQIMNPGVMKLLKVAKPLPNHVRVMP